MLFSVGLCAQPYQCNQKTLDLDRIFTALHAIEAQSSEQSSDSGFLVDSSTSDYKELFEQCLDGRINKTLLLSFSAKQQQRLEQALSHLLLSLDDRISRYLVMLLEAKKAQARNSEDLLQTLYHSYIFTRQLDKASTLAQQYPNTVFSYMPPVLNISDGKRTLFELDKDQLSIEQQSFDFPKGGHLIVVGSPICGPCKMALSWFKAKPQLLKVLTQHSTWIMPVFGEFYFDEMKENHNAYAPIRMKYAVKESQWPEITYWGTPSFYFYLDGKVVKQVVGWPKQGREKEIRIGLKQISLI